MLHLSIHYIIFLFLIIRPTPRSTLFPYTTLFRSLDLFGNKLLTEVGGGGILFKHPVKGSLVEDIDPQDRKSTRLNSSHVAISYAVFCLKKKNSISKFYISNFNTIS